MTSKASPPSTIIPRIIVLIAPAADHPCVASWIQHHPRPPWIVEHTDSHHAAAQSVVERGGVLVDLVAHPRLYCTDCLDPIVESIHHGFQDPFHGVCGFCPDHPFARSMLDPAFDRSASVARFRNVVSLPPYTFRPEEGTETPGTPSRLYLGHAKVYASIRPDGSLPARRWVSLLICSLDTTASHLRPCLESIMHQTGEFGIEVVWVNDGSSSHHTALLRRELDHLERFSRRLQVRYHENDRNLGVAGALRKGLTLCSHELVFRMDADDVMEVHRMRTQLQFMDAHPETVLCGGQMQIFADGPGQSDKQNRRTNHRSWTAETYAGSSATLAWIVNHPTMCFRRDAVLAVGGYRVEYNGVEDLDLVLRVMMQYGHFHNLGSVLVRHRRHRTQVTRRIEADVAKVQRRARMQIQLIDHFKKNHRQVRSAGAAAGAGAATASATTRPHTGPRPFPIPRR